MQKWLIFMLLVVALPIAAADDDLTKLKEELKHQQEVLQQLQIRIHQMEAEKEPPTRPHSATHHLMPEIAFVMDMTWINRDVNDASFSRQTVPGFQPSGHSHQHSSAGNQGFNLNYGELVLSSSMSPRTSLHAAFHLTEDSFEIEEAYLDWTHPGQGWEARIGKFRSGFSMVNRVHPHAWNFVDAPLIQSLLFGEHGLIETGILAGWTGEARENTLSIRMEWLQGANSESFGTDGFDWNETSIPGADGADLITALFDLRTTAGPFTFIGGISAARGTRRMLRSEDMEDEHDHKTAWAGMQTMGETEPPIAEYGDSDLLGYRLRMEYLLSDESGIILSSEYLRRTINGTAFDEVGTIPLNRKQAGWYSSLVYQMNHRWRTGIRYDRIQENRLTLEGLMRRLPEGMDRWTGMVEYHPAFPMRIRIQYSRDNAHWIDHIRNDDNSLIVQFTVFLGNHDDHNHHEHESSPH